MATEAEGFADQPMPGMPEPPAPDDERPSEPTMDLLEAAWGIIANANEGNWDRARPDWRQAAERWRDRYHVVLKAFCEGRPADSLEAASADALPDGEYARVEIMGHDSHTGWVTDGTRGGAPVMVIRNWGGHVIAEVPGTSLYRFVPLPTPLKRPDAEPQRALNAARCGLYEDDREDDVWDERNPF